MGARFARTPEVRRRYRSATGAALGKMNLHNVYADGQQVAGLDEAGKLDVLSRLTAFSNTDAGKTQVVVSGGETLRSLAQRVYGNASLWYVIAAANALNGDEDLVAGASLTVPEVRVSSNDANTFKPYNPGEITGPTSPGLPYIPPPDAGCGKVGLVIMVAIAVVVAVYAGPAVAGFMDAAMGAGLGATVAAGAATGAASAAVSSAAGSVMGVASFSWKGVAAGAVTGAITAGLASEFGSVGKAIEATRYGKATALAFANAGASYAGQKLMGMDVSFSWKSIAASAVSTMVSAKVTPKLVDKFGLEGERAYDFASGMTGGMVSAAVRTSFGQTLHTADYAGIVADAVGNVISNSAARRAELERMEDRVSKDMQRSISEWQTKNDTTIGGLAQSSLDRLSDAAMERNFMQADARFQQRLYSDHSSWQASERAKLTTEPSANSKVVPANVDSPMIGGASGLHGYSAVDELISDLGASIQKNSPSYMRPLHERYNLGGIQGSTPIIDPAIDPATGRPWPKMEAYDDTWTLERARGERELKAWQNRNALDERVGNMLAFFGPKYDNGTISGQLVNPITGDRVSASAKEQAIGDVLGVATMFIGAPAATRSGAASKLTPAQEAAAWQGSELYPGIDRYRNIVLKPDTYVVGAVPGQGNYYTTMSGMIRSELDVIKYYEGLQVAPNLTNPARDVVRDGLTIYRVTESTPAAFARTLTNPQHGAGGLPQIYIPNNSTLQPVGFIPFSNKVPGVKP